MPDDGKRREAIGGELYVTPPPRIRHREISLALAVALHEILVRGGYGKLFPAPVGAEFPATNEGVQPDLVFVAKERDHIVDEGWIRGAPDLIVEILSPSTEERDRGVKLRLCWRHGVPEYWIVDPEAGLVEVWDFRGEEPVCRRFIDRMPVQLGGEVVDEIELGEVFPRD